MKSSQARHRQPWLPTLLQRLQDDAPNQQTEVPQAYAADISRMRELVLNDLSLLLNANPPSAALAAERYPAVVDSVLNYGVPVMTGKFMDDYTWADIETAMRAALIRHEPRLIPDSLVFTPTVTEQRSHHNVLTFEISGLIHLLPYPLEFRVQSAFDLETSKASVRLIEA